MSARWPTTLLLIAVLTAGWAGRAAQAQDSRDRRSSYDDSRDRRRSYDDSRDRRRSEEGSRYRGSSSASDSRGTSASGFDLFRILEERNIFDPARRPMLRNDAPPPPAPSAPVAESFTLQGVLLDTGEAVAFFEGSSPEFNAAVKLGGIIGGHKVVEIQTDRVMLASTTRKMDLPVAWQMSRRAGGEWEATTATISLASSSPALPTPSYGGSSYGAPSGGAPSVTTMAPGSPAPGAPAAAAGSADEMLKRLMERRRKEMGQ